MGTVGANASLHMTEYSLIIGGGVRATPAPRTWTERFSSGQGRFWVEGLPALRGVFPHRRRYPSGSGIRARLPSPGALRFRPVRSKYLRLYVEQIRLVISRSTSRTIDAKCPTLTHRKASLNRSD